MERIAAIVEGHLEAHFMKETYPRVLVQRCIPNGESVSLDLIVQAISDQLDVMDGELRHVVVLLDRERRTDSSESIANYLQGRLSCLDSCRRFYIGVADREAENWILADVNFIIERFNVEGYKYDGDGFEGKARLKKIAARELAPRDKARLLKSISPSRASAWSPSLAKLIEQIDFPWYWPKS